jgi:hypothetical protein
MPMARILPSIREDVRDGKRCVQQFRAVSGARLLSLAVSGAAPRAGTDAALALAVSHARRTRGMHARRPTSADSTLAVAGGAFPVLPAMRTVRRPHGEARRRQQHHQTSRQNETMHHHSLLVAVRLLCRHRWPCTERSLPVGTHIAERPPITTAARRPPHRSRVTREAGGTPGRRQRVIALGGAPLLSSCPQRQSTSTPCVRR